MTDINTVYPRPKKYTVQYSCTNCGWSGGKKFDVGSAAPQTTRCSKCECNTAKKSIALPYVPPKRVDPSPIMPLPEPHLPWNPWSPCEPPQPWRDDRYKYPPYRRVINTPHGRGVRDWEHS